MPQYSLKYSRRAARTALFAFFILIASRAFADNSKISPDLQPLLSNPSNTINVIVQYNTPPQQSSGGLLGGLLGGVVNLLGGVLNTVFSLIPAVSATMHPADILGVSNQSNVTYISLDRTLGASLDYTAAAVSAPSAWSSGWDGSGIGVAVIDSGIYNHPDLNAANSRKSRVVYRQSFIGGALNDDFGHGTHVAGIVAGNGTSSDQQGAFRTFKGIAPNANILDLRVLDQNGASNDSVVIAAIQKAVQLKSKYNVRVINLSLGRQVFEGCSQDPLCQAVEAAWKSGIVVVVAAGNLGREGYSTILSPGSAPHAITVGAMKTEATMNPSDDHIASYSSRGPTNIDLIAKPDVVAPGNLVDSLLAPGSTLVNDYPGNIVPASSYTNAAVTGTPLYFQLSGTSMATPVVSGAAALMLQKDPSLTPDTVKARLMKTASKNFPVMSTATDPTTGQTYTDFYDMFTVGAGYVNIASALTDYDQVRGSAASPQVTYNALLETALLVPNFAETWWSTPTWLTSTVWGPAVLVPGPAGTMAIWGTNVSWGTGIQGEQ